MRSFAVLLLCCAASACVPQYRPPTFEQPHAIVKFRRSYGYAAGASLSEQLTVDGHQAYARTSPAGSANAPQTDAVLVHPQAARFLATSTFFHMETRAVQESYSVQVPYSTMESYSCGYGTSYRTCTRSATHYRSETRYRTVMRSVQVTDATCSGASGIAPRANDVYVLEFNFQAPGVCRLSCFQQWGQPDGSFEMRPCAIQPSPAR
jgi:hypothetical protein